MHKLAHLQPLCIVKATFLHARCDAPHMRTRAQSQCRTCTKQTTAPCSVYTGQLFESELKRLPHMVMTWVSQIVNSFSRVVRSATLVENREGTHCVMFPLILGAQAVCISHPGALLLWWLVMRLKVLRHFPRDFGRACGLHLVSWFAALLGLLS